MSREVATGQFADYTSTEAETEAFRHLRRLDCEGSFGGRLQHSPSTEASVDGDVKTIMVYTRVLNRGPRGVLSPIDKMPDGDMRISISLLLRAGCSAELVASKANYVASSTDFFLRLIQTTGIVY